MLKNNIYKIGSCKHSDIATFSLHPLKTITTGEGGIVTTNNKILDEKIKKLRSHGIKRNKKKHWDYDVEYSGFNFRLNDFQCALGISQLKNLNFFLNKRKKIANKYIKNFNKINSIIMPTFKKEYLSSYHLFLISIEDGKIKMKEKFIKYMLKNKVIIQFHYIPIYKFKNFNGKFIKTNSEIYYNSCVSLPIYVSLSNKDQEYIISKVISFFKINKHV
jgi:dTDP-4-amino-4,6-dideoxygalactose transaminase